MRMTTQSNRLVYRKMFVFIIAAWTIRMMVKVWDERRHDAVSFGLLQKSYNT